jgi:hypothetical protein
MPIKKPDSNTKRHRNHCSRAEHSIKRVPKSIATASGRKGDAWNGLRVVGRAKAGEERKGTFACGAVGQGESGIGNLCLVHTSYRYSNSSIKLIYGWLRVDFNDELQDYIVDVQSEARLQCRSQSALLEMFRLVVSRRCWRT